MDKVTRDMCVAQLKNADELAFYIALEQLVMDAQEGN